MMPKRGCDVQACEITRFYRVNNNGFVAVHPFVVPRKVSGWTRKVRGWGSEGERVDSEGEWVGLGR